MSYTKKRHILECNLNLQNKFLIEQSSVKNVYSKESDGYNFYVIKYPTGFYVTVSTPQDPKPQPVEKVFKYSITFGDLDKGKIITGYKKKEDAQSAIDEIINHPEYKKTITQKMTKTNTTPKEENEFVVNKNNITPKEESEFVVNKNPFKDEQYKSARKSNNPNLTNGDLFTKWISNIEPKFLEFVDEKLRGKSIRYSTRNDKGTDIQVLLVFGENIFAKKVYLNDKFETIPTKPVVSDIRFEAKYKPENSATENKILFALDLSSGEFMDYYYGYPFNDTKINQLKQFNENPDAWYTKLSKYLISDALEVKNIPDNFFEIRKVLKIQTDFNP